MTSGPTPSLERRPADRLLEFMVSLAHGGELNLLDDVEVLAGLLPSPQHRELAKEVRSLLETYVYEQSLEYIEASTGKSGAYRAYLSKQEDQPLRRQDRAKQFRAAVRDLMDSDRILQFLPPTANCDIADLRSRLEMLNVRDSGSDVS